MDVQSNKLQGQLSRQQEQAATLQDKIQSAKAQASAAVAGFENAVFHVVQFFRSTTWPSYETPCNKTLSASHAL